MSIPTFNGTALVSKAERDLPRSIAPRVAIETLPGVDGEYVQPLGHAGRAIAFRGLLEGAAADTSAAAHQSLKTALRTKQALVDGSTVAAYVGTDGSSYSNCILLSYEPVGQVRIYVRSDQYIAGVFVAGTVRHLAP